MPLKTTVMKKISITKEEKYLAGTVTHQNNCMIQNLNILKYMLVI